jgi:septal ring factor EnvC (AmiA/AmiB activator)
MSYYYLLVFCFLSADISLYCDNTDKTSSAKPFLCGAATATALLVMAIRSKKPLPKLSTLFQFNRNKEVLHTLQDEIKTIKKQLGTIETTQHKQGDTLTELVKKTENLEIKITDIKKDTHFTAQVLQAALENNKGMMDRLLVWFKGSKLIGQKTEQKKIE